MTTAGSRDLEDEIRRVADVHALEREAWEGGGRTEFRAALVRVMNRLDPGYDHDLPSEAHRDRLDDLWVRGCELMSTSSDRLGAIIEGEQVVDLRVDDWVERLFSSRGNVLREEIRRLARRSRDPRG